MLNFFGASVRWALLGFARKARRLPEQPLELSLLRLGSLMCAPGRHDYSNERLRLFFRRPGRVRVRRRLLLLLQLLLLLGMPLHQLLCLLLVLPLHLLLFCVISLLLSQPLMVALLLLLEFLPFLILFCTQLFLLLLVFLVELGVPGVGSRRACGRWKFARVDCRAGVSSVIL